MNTTYLSEHIDETVITEKWLKAREKLNDIHPALKFALLNYSTSLRPLVYYVYAHPEFYFNINLTEAGVPSYANLNQNLEKFILKITNTDWRAAYKKHQSEILEPKVENIDIFVRIIIDLIV